MDTAPMTPAGTQTLRVLVVDDEAIVRESLLNWLNATGPHTPLCISDGAPAADPPNPMNATPLSATDCY